MANYTVTAASVLASVGATTRTGVAGATITAGQYLYIDTANSNVLKLADANGTAVERVVAGVALHASLTGQPIKYATLDPAFVPGFTTAAVGDIVILDSATPGDAQPSADATAGDYVTVLGVMTSTTAMNFKPTAAGAVKV